MQLNNGLECAVDKTVSSIMGHKLFAKPCRYLLVRSLQGERKKTAKRAAASKARRSQRRAELEFSHHLARSRSANMQDGCGEEHEYEDNRRTGYPHYIPQPPRPAHGSVADEICCRSKRVLDTNHKQTNKQTNIHT